MDPAPLPDAFYNIAFALLLGLGVFMIGLENRYPIVANPPFRTRMRHCAANIGIWLYTLVLVDLLLAKPLFGSSLLATHSQRGPLHGLGLSWPLTAVVGFLVLDFASYVLHYALHRIPWLWRCHAVHHTDPDVDLSTTFRVHPIESALGLVWYALILFSLGLPVWVIALRELVKTPLVLMQHANVRIPERADRILRLVLATPNVHKIHHSPRKPETDSNYGVVLSVWDRLFGTLTTQRGVEGPRYGLAPVENGKLQTVMRMLKSPWSGRFAGSGD